MKELSDDASGIAMELAPDENAPLRELLVRYHQALARVQTLAAALLDSSQPDAPAITPEQLRARRHAAGEALAAANRDEAFAQELWKSLGVERRLAPTGSPLPRAIQKDRRRKARRGFPA
jgi:hypothetical protein